MEEGIIETVELPVLAMFFGVPYAERRWSQVVFVSYKLQIAYDIVDNWPRSKFKFHHAFAMKLVEEEKDAVRGHDTDNRS